jgi:hypothetical protein
VENYFSHPSADKMAKDSEITEKLEPIFLRFPMEIDYPSASPEWTASTIQTNYLKAISKSGSLSEVDRNHFYQVTLPEAVIETLDRYLSMHASLSDMLWVRSEHYRVAPQESWQPTLIIIAPEPTQKISAKPNPTKLPIKDLPYPKGPLSSNDLQIYCERRAIQLILDLVLIIAPEKCHLKISQFLIDELTRPEIFEQALTLEPLLADTKIGRAVRSINLGKNRILAPTRVKANGARSSRYQTRTFSRDNPITPFLRLLMVLRTHSEWGEGRKFTFTQFKSTCLRAYFDADATMEDQIPHDENFKKWFPTIMGEKRANRATKPKKPRKAHK